MAVKPVVEMTRQLESALRQSGVDPSLYITALANWVARGKGEFDHDWFGKNTPYSRPKPAAGRQVLYHVHLAPEEPFSEEDFESPEEYAKSIETFRKWNYSKKHRRGRPVSDDSLVYAFDDSPSKPRYLIIHIFWSPDAHEVIEMKTERDRRLMNQFLDVAETYVTFGKIVL